MVHGGCYTVLTADKEQAANLLERKRFQTQTKRKFEGSVNKEGVRWTYGSCCSLLYGGQESNAADSPKRKNLNKRRKGVLETTQTQVTQSPKPKPRVTATDLRRGLRGIWFGGRGIIFQKGEWGSAAQVHHIRWGI